VAAAAAAAATTRKDEDEEEEEEEEEEDILRLAPLGWCVHDEGGTPWRPGMGECAVDASMMCRRMEGWKEGEARRQR